MYNVYQNLAKTFAARQYYTKFASSRLYMNIRIDHKILHHVNDIFFL